LSWIAQAEEGCEAALKLLCTVMRGNDDGDGRPGGWWKCWTRIEKSFPAKLLTECLYALDREIEMVSQLLVRLLLTTVEEEECAECAETEDMQRIATESQSPVLLRYDAHCAS